MATVLVIQVRSNMAVGDIDVDITADKHGTCQRLVELFSQIQCGAKNAEITTFVVASHATVEDGYFASDVLYDSDGTPAVTGVETDAGFAD